VSTDKGLLQKDGALTAAATLKLPASYGQNVRFLKVLFLLAWRNKQ
jgi:hypothetical protein